MTNFHFNYRNVTEAVKWYLTHDPVGGSMLCLPSSTSSYGYHNTSETDLVNFAGNLSFEVCRLGQEWTCLLKRAKYSSLICLLGASGVIVYLMKRKKRRPDTSGRPNDPTSPTRDGRRRFAPNTQRRRFNQKASFWQWFLQEELVEDFRDNSCYMHSQYFGPSTDGGLDEYHGQLSPIDKDGSLNGLLGCEGLDDLSLNSFALESSPKKFLKRPLFDIRHTNGKWSARREGTPLHTISNPCPRCVKGICRLKKHQQYNINNSSSASSGSPQNLPMDLHKYKTSTPDMLELVLRRGGGSTSLSKKDPFLIRRDGDGSEDSSGDLDQNYNNNNNNTATPLRVGGRDQYRPTYLLYGGNNSSTSSRGSPDGKERWSLSPVQRSRCSSTSNYDLTSSCGGAYQGEFRGMRDASLDSIADNQSCSVTGSMLDLVENAREVRRLIRETSFDSNASDMSLDFSLNDNIGESTSEDLNVLCQGLSRLIDNCDNIEEDLTNLPDPNYLPSSKSTTSGLSGFLTEGSSPPDDLKRDGSVPDLKALQKSLKHDKGVWRLTNFSRDDTSFLGGSRHTSVVSDAGSSSLEWESPVHGWHDVKPFKLAPGLNHSSNVSESGDEVGSFAGSNLDAWEWDNDCYYMGGEVEELGVGEWDQAGHSTWLPDIGTELDLEAELRFQSAGRRGTLSRSRSGSFSRQPSSASDITTFRRLPPSGRSSVDREFATRRHSASSRGSSISDDLTITSSATGGPKDPCNKNSSCSGLHAVPRSISLTSKLGACGTDQLPSSAADSFRRIRNSSFCSEESGYQEGDTSMDSSICSYTSSGIFTSSINLSPVKEAKEPPTSPTSPLSPPDVVFGEAAISDTVIKVTMKQPSPEEKNSKVSRGLMFEDPPREQSI